jgi:hypothetical protein
MNEGKLVFAQTMEHVPWRRFGSCVNRYKGDYKVKKLKCADLFRIMAFGQLTYCESLRSIVTRLNAFKPKLYHMGMRCPITRSTLADANNTRDWRIFADFAHILISIAKPLHLNDDIGIDLDNTVYALDASTIDLCLSLFPWASFRKTKAAVKLHTMIDLRGNIPEFMLITDGKVHDVNAMDFITYQPGAYYVMDRGYLDFTRLFALNQSRAYFVIRAKSNTKYKRQYSCPVDKTTGVQCDQIGHLSGRDALENYPKSLRRIRYYDSILDKRFVFLTNHMELSAKTVADIYRLRWQIELFFKWIKQHLYVKVFYGETSNAVKSQLWIAICTYVLIAIIRKRLMLETSLYDILQILTVSQFEKAPLSSLFLPFEHKTIAPLNRNQLTLFDL